MKIPNELTSYIREAFRRKSNDIFLARQKRALKASIAISESPEYASYVAARTALAKKAREYEEELIRFMSLTDLPSEGCSNLFTAERFTSADQIQLLDECDALMARLACAKDMKEVKELLARSGVSPFTDPEEATT